VGRLSLRLESLPVEVVTKTLDNVFVTVAINLQYQVIDTKIYNAFYVLKDQRAQMISYVEDSIRTSMCSMTLDHAYAAKEEVSSHLKSHLADVFEEYGYKIIKALVTDLTPDQKVRDAMNEINSSKRVKEAAAQRAEGEKIIKVKRAEAEAESMYLSGLGVARQRKAIMDGLKESIVDFGSQVTGTTPKDVMDLLVLTQYFDTMQEVGHSSSTKTVFLANDHNPTRAGMMQANAGF